MEAGQQQLFNVLLPRDKMGGLAYGRSQLEGAKTAHVNTWIQPEGEEINSDFTPPGKRDPATAPDPIPCAAQAQLAAALHLLHPHPPRRRFPHVPRVDGPGRRSVQAAIRSPPLRHRPSNLPAGKGLEPRREQPPPFVRGDPYRHPDWSLVPRHAPLIY